jgi:hypothetical protein
MTEDPIVAEIRKIRNAHAAKFNNDLAAICADFRRQEKESGGHYVSYPPRLIKKTATSEESTPPSSQEKTNS